VTQRAGRIGWGRGGRKRIAWATPKRETAPEEAASYYAAPMGFCRLRVALVAEVETSA
jgi:hypothetical protein